MANKLRICETMEKLNEQTPRLPQPPSPPPPPNQRPIPTGFRVSFPLVSSASAWRVAANHVYAVLAWLVSITGSQDVPISASRTSSKGVFSSTTTTRGRGRGMPERDAGTEVAYSLSRGRIVPMLHLLPEECKTDCGN